DQTGFVLLAPAAASFVKATSPVPSAFTTQMLAVLLALAAPVPSSSREDENAILVPSGDQTGLVLSAPKAVRPVKKIAPVPSRFTTQMLVVLLTFAASLPPKARPES